MLRNAALDRTELCNEQSDSTSPLKRCHVATPLRMTEAQEGRKRQDSQDTLEIQSWRRRWCAWCPRIRRRFLACYIHKWYVTSHRQGLLHDLGWFLICSFCMQFGLSGVPEFQTSYHPFTPADLRSGDRIPGIWQNLVPSSEELRFVHGTACFHVVTVSEAFASTGISFVTAGNHHVCRQCEFTSVRFVHALRIAGNIASKGTWCRRSLLGK